MNRSDLIKSLDIAIDGLERARSSLALIDHHYPIMPVAKLLLGQVFILLMAVRHWRGEEQRLDEVLLHK